MIYVRAVLALIRSEVDVHGLAHITGGGLLNLRRIGAGVGYSINDPLPSPPVFELIAPFGEVPPPRCGRSSTWAAASSPMVAAPTGRRAPSSCSPASIPARAVIGAVTDGRPGRAARACGVRAAAGSERLTY